VRHAGLLASESVIFKALVIGVLVTFNLPELEVPGLALVPPDRRWRGRKVAGTFHVPSARFNQAHLSPWLSAERSLTALSDGCNRMERTRNAFPRLVSSLHLYGCETGCDMRD